MNQNDIFFSLDQQLANKLVASLTIPLKIDVLNPRYFNPGAWEETEIDSEESLASDLFEASLKSLEYAENRDETITEEIQEDEELYEIAKIAIDAFLAANPTERDPTDESFSSDYSFEQQKSLWGRIKKYAKKASNWLKKQAKKILKIKSVTLDKFLVTVEKRPVIIISNPIKVNDVYLKIDYKITVKYEIFGKGGRISFSDNFKMPNTDLDIKFKVDNLKYFAEPYFTSLKIVKYILGFKITISLAPLVNKKIKPMEIFDASKYIPEIPWFEKSFVPEPPLGLLTYGSGLSFGVNFKLRD
ncbi:hypothetical protein BB050_00787 [Flavobacterium anhuiense]|uniref:Uncharacterized protein n=1 Tax=Flavobacterium anhuiense TaxID=459526 RepID=A0AAC9CXL9_9FLAO|nr:hypothetical protein [Flavobacterium anhuiense]AOC93929.1 hypothetical protein BB050_00787 [Flavobacterium anhuiense]SCY98353.1 hypothetical protein SAMN02927916_4518 [Flavobacterium anhuiense]